VTTAPELDRPDHDCVDGDIPRRPVETLVRSRIQPAAVPATAVPRPTLVQRLDAAATTKKLTLLLAPPGYGKTVLLAQWSAAHPDRRLAWLTAEAADDAVRFARHLCAALSRVDGRPREALLDRVEDSGRRLGPGFITALLAEAAVLPPMAVVIDDFHTMANGPLLADVGLLIETAPPTLHFVLAARMDPPLPYHRFRLEDELAEIRQDDLRFGKDQTLELVQLLAHRRLTDRQLEQLLGRTEGWCAGIQLAALSLRREPDVEAFISAFAGDDRHVAEYLTEHVLRHQPPYVRSFLLQTSPLRRLTAPLCDAVTGRCDSQEVLDHLDRSSLFVSRLDDHREWFRYHHLFRTLLRQHLREEGGVDERELLLKAANWHLARDELEQGVEYLSKAGATARVLEAARTHGHAMVAKGRLATVLGWIDAVDDDGDADIVLLRAGLHTLAGDTLLAGALLDDLVAREAVTAGQRLVAEFLRTCSVHDEPSPERVLAAASRAVGGLSAGPVELPDVVGATSASGIHRVSLLNGGAAAAYLGRTGQARRWTRAASAVVPDHAASDVYAAALEALLDAWGGRLRSAHQQGTWALALASQSDLHAHPEIVLAQLALAAVAREQERVDEARRLLDEAAILLQRGSPGALVGVHAAETALLALAVDDADAALEVLVGHRTTTSAAPPAVVARLDAAEARVLAAKGDLVGARQAVDRAPLVTPEVANAAARIAVEQEDLRRASELVETWPGAGEPGPALQRDLWLCIVDDLEGRREAGQARMRPLVAAAQEEGHVRLFMDAGHHALRLVRTLYHAAPSPYLRRLVDAPIPAPLPAPPPVPELVEQFSNRERAVLGFLPSRLSNAEIAANLHISINTVKTHLKHIYRKLGVDDRREAVTAAERLHLL
jgi:LuxR family maltose regulon positive regulatory protein